MVTITVAPGTADEIVLTGSDIIRQNFQKTHTGLGTFRAQLATTKALDGLFFSEVHIEDGAEFLFRGFLLSNEIDEKSGRTTISGKGIGWDLTNDETTITYDGILAYEAIDDFWTNETSFSPTVTTPTANNSTTDSSVQEANTTSEFNSILSIADDEPFVVTSDSVEMAPAADPRDTLNDRDGASNFGFADGDQYNDGQAGTIGSDGAYFEFTINFGYRIPSDAVGIQIRDENPDSVDISFKWDGTEFDRNTAGSTSLYWSDIGSGFYSAGGGYSGNIGSDIQPNTNYTLRVEANASGTYIADVIAVYDKRYNFTFPDPDATTNGGGYLSGPELYPDGATLTFDSKETAFNITEADLNTTWDDTSGNQKIQLRLGTQTWNPNDGTETNTQSITTTFGNESGRTIQGRATLDRYGTRTGALPTEGYQTQTISTWEILIDGNDLVVFENQTFEGSDFEIVQKMHSLADLRFSIDHQAGAKPVDSFQVGDVVKNLPDVDVKDKRRREATENYANHVTVRGQRVNGTRLTATESDQSEIDTYGKRHIDKFDPTLESQVAVDEAAKALLGERKRELVLKGDLDIAPVDVRPGFSYPNPFDTNADDVPLEEVRYGEGVNQLQGTLNFDFRAEVLSELIGGLQSGQNDTVRGF